MTVAFIGIDLTSMRVPASRRDVGRSARAEAPGSARGIAGRTGGIGALHDRHRSLHRRLLLAKGVRTLGHTALVIAPQHGKPFVKHRQNDWNDAEAICTALMPATMKFVPPKSELQQDIQALHRARRRLVNP
jgi:transposase